MCDPLYDSDSDPGSDFGPRCLAPGLGSRQQLIPSLLERLTRACTALRERIVNDATTWKRVMAGGKSMLIKNWAGVSPAWPISLSQLWLSISPVGYFAFFYNVSSIFVLDALCFDSHELIVCRLPKILKMNNRIHHQTQIQALSPYFIKIDHLSHLIYLSCNNTKNFSLSILTQELHTQHHPIIFCKRMGRYITML